MSGLPVTPPVATPSPVSASAGACAEDAEKFAHEWVAKATASEIAAIVADRPRIPRPIDALMLQHAVQASGLHTIDDTQRREMRAAFWAVIDVETKTVTPPTS
jgi:hypothetical protein